MKRIIISLLMISAGFLCNAQVSNNEIIQKEKTARLWISRGTDCYIANMDSAFRCFERALKIYREIESCRDEAMCLQQMAFMMMYMDNSDRALMMYDEAEGTAVRCEDTTRLLKVLNEKQRLLYKMGRMKERAVVMGKIAELGCDGKSAREKIECYQMQGKDAKDKGDYFLAEKMYEKGLELMPMLPESSQMEMKGKLLIPLRDIKCSQHQYPKALEYEKQLLELHKKTIAKKEDLALDYQMLSYINSKIGDKKMTLQYMDSAIACAGKNTNLMINVAGLLIPSLSRIGMSDAALTLAQRMDSAVIEKYGKHSKSRIIFLSYMGNIYNRMGEKDKCLDKYAECERLTLEVCGPESDEHITALNGLVNSLGLAGRIDEGAAKYVELEKMLSKIVRESMGSMSQAERESYWNRTAEIMRDMTSYGLAGHVTSKDFIDAACNALIFSKSLLLDTEVSLKELVEKKGSSDDKKRYNRIVMTKHQIDSMSNDYDKNIDKILKLKLQLSEDDYLLSARFKDYSDYTNFLNITIDDIRKSMPDNSVLIDFADIKTTDNYYHAAFITSKKTGRTSMQLVFDWKKVEQLLDGTPIDVLYKDYVNDSARNLIWEPLSKYVDEGCTIYYVPAGNMHQVSLESFTAPDGRLLGEHYKFVRLTSARELAKNKKPTSKPKAAVLYGGLQYEVSPDSMLAESKKYASVNNFSETRDGLNRDSIFRELPNTKYEVESIGATLKRAGVKVTPYIGKEGCEESFVAMSGNAPEILHIATHGFYYTPKEAATINYMKGYRDAMMLSGLVMSGANATRKNGNVFKSVCDGMLRAGDIAKMNLKGVDMVVLSACQTGLGDITPEGVYGLQRAFKLAGVNTIVMTLWSVNDATTKEFMVKFYERLVANNWNKRKAFDEARDYMRGLYPDKPYYWACFVMLD